METQEFFRYRDEFYPVGARKILAMMLIMAVTVLPELNAWQFGSGDSRGAGMPTGRFAPSGGFLLSNHDPGPKILSSIWSFLKRSFVAMIVIAGLMMYYPGRGFKRYALLCGPLIAVCVPALVAWYLRDRQEVYDVEIALATLVALVPGVGLYFVLTWRKAKRLGWEW